MRLEIVLFQYMVQGKKYINNCLFLCTFLGIQPVFPTIILKNLKKSIISSKMLEKNTNNFFATLINTEIYFIILFHTLCIDFVIFFNIIIVKNNFTFVVLLFIKQNNKFFFSLKTI